MNNRTAGPYLENLGDALELAAQEQIALAQRPRRRSRWVPAVVTVALLLTVGTVLAILVPTPPPAAAGVAVSRLTTEGAVIQGVSTDLVDGTAVFEGCMADGGYVAEGRLRVLFTNTGDFFTFEQLDTEKPDGAEAFVSRDGKAVEADERADTFWTCAEELLARATETRPVLEPLPSEFRVQVESCLVRAEKISGLVLEEAVVNEVGHLEIVFQHDSLKDPNESVLTDADRACLDQVERAFLDHRGSQDR
jgi:hypothetical protein